MDIENLEKPSDDAVKNYKEKMEDLLRNVGIAVEVVLKDRPVDRWESLNGNVRRFIKWVDGVRISNSDVSDLFISLRNRETIKDVESHKAIWDDAFCVQDSLYFHLNRSNGRPQDGDPYWKLWDRVDA